jgi:hypothetical protein
MPRSTIRPRAGELRLLAAAVLLVAAACESGRARPDFSSPAPIDRTAAIEQAVRRHRPQPGKPWQSNLADPSFRSDLAWIVVMLQSSDPAVRLLAIESLDALVGQRLGYDAADPLPLRAAAVERWVGWLRAEGIVGGETLPPIGAVDPSWGRDAAPRAEGGA